MAFNVQKSKIGGNKYWRAQYTEHYFFLLKCTGGLVYFTKVNWVLEFYHIKYGKPHRNLHFRPGLAIYNPWLQFAAFSPQLQTPFSLPLFSPPSCWREGHGKVHIPQVFMTCHKIVDCGHVQSTAPHPFWRGCPMLWHWLCRCWHFESLLYWVWEVDQNEVTKAELPKVTESSVYTALLCFLFWVPSSFISGSFWHSPGSWGHFRSGALALSPTFCFLPLPLGSYAENCLKGDRMFGSCK